MEEELASSWYFFANYAQLMVGILATTLAFGRFGGGYLTIFSRF